MSWLRRAVQGVRDALTPGSGGERPAPFTLDVEARRAQLEELERALDRLIETMRANHERMANPGWRERVAEYRRLSGEAYTLRRGGFDRERLLDLAFEIRPVFPGDDLPEDVQPIQPLQEELMRAARALQEELPGERPTPSDA